MLEIISDQRIVRILNMLHYAKEQIKIIVEELNSSKKNQYISINKHTEVEFYLTSFSQLVYILYETLINFHGKNEEIEGIFNNKKINDWKIFANKVKHNNLPPISNIPITIKLDKENNDISSSIGKGYYSFSFCEGKTKINIKNMEDDMGNVHKILLNEIKNYYKNKQSNIGS